MTIWYSSMKPGLCPAKRQSIPSTKPTMAQAMGKRAERRILAVLLVGAMRLSRERSR